MRPHIKAERPDAAERLEPSGIDAGNSKPASTPSPPLHQALIAQRAQVLERLDALEVMATWKLDLQARLARKKLIFLYCDSDTPFDELTGEVQDFVRCSKVLRYLRGQP